MIQPAVEVLPSCRPERSFVEVTVAIHEGDSRVAHGLVRPGCWRGGGQHRIRFLGDRIKRLEVPVTFAVVEPLRQALAAHYPEPALELQGRRAAEPSSHEAPSLREDRANAALLSGKAHDED